MDSQISLEDLIISKLEYQHSIETHNNDNNKTSRFL